MIYKQDMIFNFLFVKLMSAVGLVHYGFNLRKRKYIKEITLRQKILTVFWHVFIYTRIVIILSFAYMHHLKPSPKLYHELAAYGFPPAMIIILIQEYLETFNGRYVLTMNTIYDQLPSGKRKLKDYFRLKIVEMVLILCPGFPLISGAPVVSLAYLVDPNVPTMIYYGVPNEYRNFWTMLFGMICDSLTLFTVLTYLWNILVVGITFIVYYNMKLDELLGRADMALKSHASMLTRMRMLEELRKDIFVQCLRLRMFNSTARHIIFLSKQLALLTAIFGLVVFIHYFDKHVIIAFGGIALGSPGFIFYVFVFDQAFAFPTKMDAVRRKFFMAGHRMVFKHRVEYYRVLAQSFWIKGIQVGDFQALERQSTPNFCNFVSQEIASLLVGVSNV